MNVGSAIDFYVGMHQPSGVKHLRNAMVSINRLEHRKADFDPPEGKWLLDSGSFTRISSGRGHMPLLDYASLIERWAAIPGFQAAVSQDYMCEPFILRKTGMTVENHQTLTTRNYIDLRYAVADSTYIMPVIQGFTPDEYARHCWQLAPMLDEGAWIGVGSVCKRNVNPVAISAVLSAILNVRSDLRLHGFGLKTTSIVCQDIAERIHSADSMSWSFMGRKNGQGANNPLWAREWADQIESADIQASQLAMPI